MLGFLNYTVWVRYTALAVGVVGILLAGAGLPLAGVLCLLVAGFCHLFAGPIARTYTPRTPSESRFDRQMASLVSMVCFGVLPAVIAYTAGLSAWYFLPFLLVFSIAALIRLAYCDVMAEERITAGGHQKEGFVGLPLEGIVPVFPLLYLLKTWLPIALFPWVVGVMLLVLSMAFVARFALPKPTLKMTAGLLAVGLLEFIALLIWGV